MDLNKTKDILINFCSRDDLRKNLRNPFFSCGYYCATDGVLMVASKGKFKKEMSKDGVNISFLLNKSFSSIETTVKEVISIKKSICQDCNGTGKITECDECDGDGYIKLTYDGKYDDYENIEDCIHCDGTGNISSKNGDACGCNGGYIYNESYQCVGDGFYLNNHKLMMLQKKLGKCVFKKSLGNGGTLRFDNKDFFGYIMMTKTPIQDNIDNAEYK